MAAERRKEKVSHPMGTFSFRTPLALLRKLKKKARKEKKSAGEVLREILENLEKEEANERERKDCQEEGGERGGDPPPRLSLDAGQVGRDREGPGGKGV